MGGVRVDALLVGCRRSGCAAAALGLLWSSLEVVFWVAAIVFVLVESVSVWEEWRLLLVSFTPPPASRVDGAR